MTKREGRLTKRLRTDVDALHGERERKAQAERRDALLFRRIGEQVDRIREGLPKRIYADGPNPTIWREGRCAHCLRGTASPRVVATELLTCGKVCHRRMWAVLWRRRVRAQKHGALDALTVHELAELRASALDPEPIESGTAIPTGRGRQRARGRSEDPATLRGRCPYCDVRLTLKTVSVLSLRSLSLGGPNDLANLAVACSQCSAIRGHLFPDNCDVSASCARAIVDVMERHRESVDPRQLEATRAWAARQEAWDCEWREADTPVEWLTYVRWRVENGDDGAAS